MKCQFDNVAIRGVAAAVPCNTLELRSFIPQFGEIEVENIIASTGIEAVRLAPSGVTSADLCAYAAEALLSEIELPASAIDGVIFVSQTPDYILPATSICLQDRLGLSKRSPCFDIAHGCSGYIYGLFQATMLVSSGACENVLICAGDTITRHIHPSDRAVRMVFGDGGSATVVSKGKSKTSFAIYSDGSGADKLIIRKGASRCPATCSTDRPVNVATESDAAGEYLYMSGTDIMQFALREVPKLLTELTEFHGLSKNDIGFYGLHQANRFMVQYLAKKSGIDFDRVPFAISRTGNTGPASIPLLICSTHDAYEKNSMKNSILCGFGVGLSWGGCALDLSQVKIVPMLELK